MNINALNKLAEKYQKEELTNKFPLQDLLVTLSTRVIMKIKKENKLSFALQK